jgi:DNA-directed RNA polymerase specialized sigma24 family protein
MRSQLAGWHPRATREQVDDAFQEACLRAVERCRAVSQGEVFTWLRTTAHRQLLNMERRARREVLVEDPDALRIDAATAGPRGRPCRTLNPGSG